MANLVVSNLCNLKCPYCFASVYMARDGKKETAAFIDLETYQRHLDFLERSQIQQVRLIGGEPTLHSRFPELIHMARRREFNILLFSHGLMPAVALECLTKLSPDQCLVLVNMNTARKDHLLRTAEIEHRRYVIDRLGPRAMLGHNIYQTNIELEYLLPLIQESDCKPAIRLGLAQPVLAGVNAYLLPKHYPLMGQKIARFARQAAVEGITLEFDCGFVRCMFSDEDMNTLKECGADIGWRCNPVLDISIDGQAIHCFPLTGRVETPLTEKSDAVTLRQRLVDFTQPYRTSGIYRECSTCRFKQQGNCSGGCLSNTMRRFRHQALSLRMPATR